MTSSRLRSISSAGSAKLAHRLKNDSLADPVVTGGDLDAQWEGAQFSGDESAGSSMPSPDQNVVEEIGQAMGVTYQDNEELKVGEKERDARQESLGARSGILG